MAGGGKSDGPCGGFDWAVLDTVAVPGGEGGRGGDVGVGG